MINFVNIFFKMNLKLYIILKSTIYKILIFFVEDSLVFVSNNIKRSTIINSNKIYIRIIQNNIFKKQVKIDWIY